MDASSPPDRKRCFSSVNEYKSAKRTPGSGKDHTGGTRVLELTNWAGPDGVEWNTAIDAIAFVGMVPFKEKLKEIFTNVIIGDVEMIGALTWADHQPCMLFHCMNDSIDIRIDTVLDMVNSFGFDMSMAKIHEALTEGTPPAPDPEAGADAS
eukprot:528215-Prymnesium_polylepis.2